MSTELEDLVRSTLHEHAGSIGTGPPWLGAPARGPRHWPAIVAAAAVVVMVSGGVAWRFGTSNPDAAGDRRPAVCDATLPAAWQRAIAGPAYSIGDYTPPIDGVFADRSAVAAPVGRGFHNELLQIHASGTVSLLYRPPAGSYASTTDLNGQDLVASIPTTSRNRTGPGIADIVAVNSHTHRVTHLLASAPVGLRPSTKDTQAVGDAVVQGNTAYWTVDGHGTRPGFVVGFNLRTHQYRKVATFTGSNYLRRDARGVYWRGGSILAPHLPSPVAALAARTTQQTFDDTYVVSDGSHYAWAHANKIHWAGPNGAYAQFTAGQNSSGHFGPYSVTGHFILTNTPSEPDTYHLLDAETGALAPLHINVEGSVASVGPVLYLTRPVTWPDGLPGNKTVPIDTARLPALHC